MVDLSKMTKWDMGKLFDFSVLPNSQQKQTSEEGVRLQKNITVKHFVFHLLIGLQL